MLSEGISENEMDVLNYLSSLEIESPIPVKNNSVKQVVESFGVKFPKQGIVRLISSILLGAGYSVSIGDDLDPEGTLRKMEYNGIWLFELGDEPELSLHGGNCVHIFKFSYDG